jgi:hypothetical protein
MLGWLIFLLLVMEASAGSFQYWESVEVLEFM